MYTYRGLDVSPYMVEGAESSAMYDLYGVVNHYGSMIGGHYTAYVRSPQAGDTAKSQVGKSLADVEYC